MTVIAAGGLLLGASACGGDKKADAPSESAPKENTEGKNDSFSSTFKMPAKVPEKWDGGSGWSEDHIGKVIALPKAIAYSSLSVDNDTHFENSNFFFYDADGKIIGKSEEPKELDSKSERIAGRAVTVYSDGKTYVVYGQQGISKPDPTSTKKAAPLTIITVFDDMGKQLSRKTVDLKVNGPDYGLQSVFGAATIVLDPVTNDSLVIDPTDGSMEKPPTSVTPGAKWSGRVDGVDLFYVGSGDPTGKTPGTLTNGSWKLPVDITAHPLAGSAVKGQYFSLLKMSATDVKLPTEGCMIIDAHSGKPAPGSSGLKGACAIPESVAPRAPLTAIGGFLAEDRSAAKTSADPGIPSVYDPLLEKAYVVPSGISFQPVAPAADGMFYGTATPASGDHKVASLNLKSGEDPKVLVDVERVPLAVSGNGIALFSGDSISGITDKAFFMIPKK